MAFTRYFAGIESCVSNVVPSFAFNSETSINLVYVITDIGHLHQVFPQLTFRDVLTPTKTPRGQRLALAADLLVQSPGPSLLRHHHMTYPQRYEMCS